jgi:parallel beta-helix repeat protein
MKYLFICYLLAVTTVQSQLINRTIQVNKGENLQTIIDISMSGDTIKIGEGEFKAIPDGFADNECGNCSEYKTSVMATRGFIVEDKSLTIIGASPFKTKLVTNAGYGFLFSKSDGSSISNLTITGGRRDTSANATDAGIVVQNSAVHIKNVHIKDNNEQASGVIIGIAGIVGREASELVIEKCIIRNNSWDGIALYRGARALIIDNLIEQGRGAGIGVTWDAQATILRNSVSYYWKGIGTFGSSKAIVQNNCIFENLGWGVVVTGASNMKLGNNVITRNGNCGLAVWDSSASAKIYNNAVTDNGWREEWVCPQVGFWMNGDTSKIKFENNDVWNNIMGNYRNISDKTGIDGNISADPQFVPDSGFKTQSTSPLHNLVNPKTASVNGKKNHIGID